MRNGQSTMAGMVGILSGQTTTWTFMKHNQILEIR
jgi:hypothetical protein